MKRDEEKTKRQLIDELTELRRRLAEFEASKAGLRQPERVQNLKHEVYMTIQQKLPT